MVFRRKHIGERCIYKLTTVQTRSVEFGYLDNRHTGNFILDDTMLKLRHK